MINITISEIDKEIERLKDLRTHKEKEQLLDSKQYVGKFYRNGNDNSIGKIYKVDAQNYGVLRSHCLWFDDEEFSITGDDDGLTLDNIEVISEHEFMAILNGWVSQIIKYYGITL